ncbi:MAG TPA: tetratricopeptide repeat protein, partial [Nitrospirota bacterium]
MDGKLGEMAKGISPNVRMFIIAALIFVCSLAAYANSFSTGFHFDDHYQIEQNEHFKNPRNIPKLFTDARLASYQNLRGYRPVLFATYALNYAVGGGNPAGFHIVNFAIHWLDSLLVLAVLLMVLKRAGVRDAGWISVFAAAAFALHPLQSSAVTYISGRSVLLASFFYLLSLVSFIAYRRGIFKVSGAVSLFLSLVFYMSGLLSKEMAVSLPAVILAYDLTVGRDDFIGAGAVRKYLPYALFAGVLAVFLALKISLQGSLADPSASVTAGQYLMSQGKVLLIYLRLLLLPVNQNASYDLEPLKSFEPAVAAAAFIAAGLAFTAFRLRTKNPAASFFLAWFILALAPESSLVPIPDIAVEYRMYLPSAGLLAALAILVFGMVRGRRVRAAVCAAIIVLFGLLTFSRNRVYANEYTFWSDVANKSPHSARARSCLAKGYFEAGDFRKAIEELNKAREMHYRQSENINVNIGLCYQRLGDRQEAVNYYQESIRISPDSIEAYLDLASVYFETGRKQDAL